MYIFIAVVIVLVGFLFMYFLFEDIPLNRKERLKKRQKKIEIEEIPVCYFNSDRCCMGCLQPTCHEEEEEKKNNNKK